MAESAAREQEFRRALACFPTGVTIVTTKDPDGGDRGLTVSSFNAVSLNPPLVSVCIADTAASHPAFEACEHFVVNVLTYEQVSLARLFGSRAPDRFAAVTGTRGLGDVFVLDDCMATFECSVYDRHPAGDHLVLYGEVERFSRSTGSPLGFGLGAFHSVNPRIAAQDTVDSDGVRISWIFQSGPGQVLAESTADGLVLPHMESPSVSLADEALVRRCEEAFPDLEIESPILYSVFDRAGRLTLVYRTALKGDVQNLGERYVLLALNDIDRHAFGSATEMGILRRFSTEEVRGEYGIYTGSDLTGQVFPVGQGVRS